MNKIRKQDYLEAIKLDKKEFKFAGEVFVVGYTKYLIEHLETQKLP